jgi:hypothetical protein
MTAWLSLMMDASSILQATTIASSSGEVEISIKARLMVILKTMATTAATKGCHVTKWAATLLTSSLTAHTTKASVLSTISLTNFKTKVASRVASAEIIVLMTLTKTTVVGEARTTTRA